MNSLASTVVKSVLLFLLFVGLAQAQVDTLISYDVRTRTMQVVVNQFLNAVSDFDHTQWHYGTEPGFSNLSLQPPVDPFPGAGFTDYRPAQHFFPVSNYPVRASVKLFRFLGDSLRQNCSGIMIGEDIVLTSTHCLYSYFDSSKVLLFADSILVSPAFDNGIENPTFGSSVSRMYYIPKKNLTSFVSQDIALIKLSHPLGLKTGWVGVAFAAVDSFFQNSVFHKFSYPAAVDISDSTRVFNGDTLYYNYGLLDVIQQKYLGYNIYGIRGQSGSSLLYTDNSRYYSVGTLSFAGESSHARVTKGLFYAFKEVLDDVVTSVEQADQVPKDATLLDPFPNPFNPITTLTFSIPNNSTVLLRVYDLLGRQVAVLQNGTMNTGTYKIVFNAQHLPSGVYVVRLETNNFIRSKKLLLTK